MSEQLEPSMPDRILISLNRIIPGPREDTSGVAFASTITGAVAGYGSYVALDNLVFTENHNYRELKRGIESKVSPLEDTVKELANVQSTAGELRVDSPAFNSSVSAKIATTKASIAAEQSKLPNQVPQQYGEIAEPVGGIAVFLALWLGAPKLAKTRLLKLRDRGIDIAPKRT